jgi:hypothetical protein
MGPDSRPRNNSSDKSHAFKYQKLNGQNYTIWAEHMQAVLQSRYLWLIISGREPCPEVLGDTKPQLMMVAEWKQEKKEYMDWLLRDKAAQGFMKGAVESSQWLHITSAKMLKEMWDL